MRCLEGRLSTPVVTAPNLPTQAVAAFTHETRAVPHGSWGEMSRGTVQHDWSWAPSERRTTVFVVVASAFHGARGQARDDPALEQEHQQYQRQGDHDRGGGELTPRKLRSGIGPPELRGGDSRPLTVEQG